MRRVLLNVGMKKAGVECYESLLKHPKSQNVDKLDCESM